MSLDTLLTSDLAVVGRTSRAARAPGIDATMATLVAPSPRDRDEGSLAYLLSLAPAYATRMGVIVAGAFALALLTAMLAIQRTVDPDQESFLAAFVFDLFGSERHVYVVHIAMPALIVYGGARSLFLARAERCMRTSADPIRAGRALVSRVHRWFDTIGVATALAFSSTFAVLHIHADNAQLLLETSFSTIDEWRSHWWMAYATSINGSLLLLVVESILVASYVASRPPTRRFAILAAAVTVATYIASYLLTPSASQYLAAEAAPPLALRTLLFLVGTAAAGVLLSTGWRLLWRAAPRSPRPS